MNKIMFEYEHLYPIKERLGKTETVKRFGNNGSSDSSPLSYADSRISVYKDRYPTSIKLFKRDKGYHPTQKPLALFEYLIKTYTNEGDLVLDNCAGSGTTAIACINLNRNYILIEKEEKYVKVAEERITNAKRQEILL